MVKTEFHNKIEFEQKNISGRLPLSDILSTDIGMAKTIQVLCTELDKLEKRVIMLENK